MFLSTKQPRSPGTRNKASLKFLSFLLPHYPNLYCGFTHSAGRNNSGKRTVFSKGAWHHRRLYRKLIPSLNKLNTLAINIAVQPRTDVRTAATLIRTAAGAWYYAPTTTNTTLFTYTKTAPISSALAFDIGAAPHWFWCIKSLTPSTKMSCVPIFYNADGVLARSAGCYCILIESALWLDWALIQLPSGIHRLISNKNWIMTGSTAPAIKHLCVSKKSTKYSQYGITSRVRGVAKNPNDHPHGGRTKSIKYARTPWGKTAKKSRKASAKTEWKVLTKRHRPLKNYAFETTIGVSLNTNQDETID